MVVAEALPVDVKLEPTEGEPNGTGSLEETLLEPPAAADELAMEEAPAVLDELILSTPVVGLVVLILTDTVVEDDATVC